MAVGLCIYGRGHWVLGANANKFLVETRL